MATNWAQYTPQAGQSAWNFFLTGPGQDMTNPFATALPSGEAVTSAATNTAKNWLSGLQNLFNTSNQGRSFYAAYDPTAKGRQAYVSGRRNEISNDTLNQALSYAKQARNLSQMRGGTGVRGFGGSAADVLQQSWAATQAQRQAQLQQLYQDYINEMASKREGAIAGFTGLTGAVGTGLGAYNTAAANQAAALAQAAQNQIAERNMVLGLYQQGLNQPSANQQRLADQMAWLQYQTALQQSMDKQAAAQTLARYYSGADAGQYGQGITDYARETDAARRAQLEQAMIAMGMLNPVQRTENENLLLGQRGGK